MRPRGIGEILDAAVVLYRNRFGQLVRYAAIVIIPVQVLLTLVLLSAQPDRFTVTITGNATPQLQTNRAQLGATFVILVVGVLTHAFVAAVTTRFVADEYVGFQESAGRAARTAYRRFFPVLAVGILVGLCELVGLLFCGVGSFAAEALFAVAVPVVILERRRRVRGDGPLGRADDDRISGTSSASYSSASLLTAMLNIAFTAGLNLWAAHGGSPTSIVIAQGIINTIAALITTPFVAAAIVTLYFDLRIRDEAFDVQMAIARMSAATTAGRSRPSAARAAQHILSGGQFRTAPTPRPLRKQLNWLGDRLHGIVDWFGRVLSHVPALLLLLAALAVLVAAITYVVTMIRARRGRRDRTRRSAAASSARTPKIPTSSSGAADAAERAGRLDVALRLRFRAGLLRLGDRGAIRYRPSLTTNEVRHALGSESFDELARTFEAVAYGGRDAAPPDLDAARQAWPHVVADAHNETGRLSGRREARARGGSASRSQS